LADSGLCRLFSRLALHQPKIRERPIHRAVRNGWDRKCSPTTMSLLLLLLLLLLLSLLLSLRLPWQLQL
jgi:hypothetical protein